MPNKYPSFCLRHNIRRRFFSDKLKRLSNDAGFERRHLECRSNIAKKTKEIGDNDEYSDFR